LNFSREGMEGQLHIRGTAGALESFLSDTPVTFLICVALGIRRTQTCVQGGCRYGGNNE